MDGAINSFDRFVDAINRRDPEALTALMTEDHVFVDSAGNRTQGRPAMADAWRRYFAICPDYWIRVECRIAERDIVLAAGEAGGTINGTGWRTLAAWKAVVRGAYVAEWQVFADNKTVYEILARRK